MQSLTVRLRTIASRKWKPQNACLCGGGGRRMNYPDVPPIVVACAQRALQRFRQFICLTPDQHSDARQVALLAAWETYTALSEVNDPAPLLRSAWNALRRWWYAEKRWQDSLIPLEYLDEDGEWCCVEMADPYAEQQIECALVRMEVVSLLERLNLSEQERELLELLSEGFSQHEVAERLGHSRVWVAWCLRAIRRRAREEGEGFGED